MSLKINKEKENLIRKFEQKNSRKGPSNNQKKQTEKE